MACEESLNYCLLALTSTLVSVIGAFVSIVKAKQIKNIHQEIKRRKG